MSLIGDIREGIAANIAASVGGLRQVSAYQLSNPTPPTVEVFPDEIAYGEANDADSLRFIVQAFVGVTGDKAAQMRLDELLLGAGSLAAAIESDPTLGGTVDSVHVTECTGYQVYQLPSAPNATVFGAQWTVEVIATQ